MSTYCIISDNKKVVSNANIDSLRVAIFVNLFYEEQIEIYKNYLNCNDCN